MMTDEEQRELEYQQAVEKLHSEPLPKPAGGGVWKNDFDYVEFTYRNLKYIYLDENIRSQNRFEQSRGWMYSFCRDISGNRYVQFLKPDEGGFHWQTILYRLDWMLDARFIRNSEKPANTMDGINVSGTGVKV